MKLTLMSVLFLSLVTQAQNLVPNNSFDSYTTPPDNYAEMCRATGWSSASGTCTLVPGTGSPDYYHTSGTGGAKPPATWWATVNTHNGGGMGGFAPWYATSANYREYIRCQLSAPLIVGTTYEVSMWLTNGASSIHGYGCNNIGVYFSNSPTNQSAGAPITTVTPQCEFNTVFWNTAWQQVMFYYKATDTFKYICIGNFHNDANTTAVKYGSGTSGCYLYLDDVVVQPLVNLPIQLTSFTASLTSNKTVNLNWETSSELNNDFFLIERAGEEQAFKTLGVTDGNGTTTFPHQYSFTDSSPGLGNNYYRLVQTDFDGSQSFSSIRVVRVAGGQTNIQFIISPNPVASNAELKIFSTVGFEKPLEVHILDMWGRKILSHQFSPLEIKGGALSLLLQNVPGGIYIVYFSDGTNLLQQEKLIVQ